MGPNCFFWVSGSIHAIMCVQYSQHVSCLWVPFKTRQTSVHSNWWCGGCLILLHCGSEGRVDVDQCFNPFNSCKILNGKLYLNTSVSFSGKLSYSCVDKICSNIYFLFKEVQPKLFIFIFLLFFCGSFCTPVTRFFSRQRAVDSCQSICAGLSKIVIIFKNKLFIADVLSMCPLLKCPWWPAHAPHGTAQQLFLQSTVEMAPAHNSWREKKFCQIAAPLPGACSCWWGVDLYMLGVYF